MVYQSGHVSSPKTEACFLHKGVSIPLILMSGVTSHAQGIVRAQVTEDVYDSVSLEKVVIPAGSQFIGRVERSQSLSSERLLIRFNEWILPHHRHFYPADFYSSNQDGTAGNTAEIDRHFWRNMSSQIFLFSLSLISEWISNAHVLEEKGVAPVDIHIHTSSVDGPQHMLDHLMNSMSHQSFLEPTLYLKAGQKIRLTNHENLSLPCPQGA